MSTNRRMWLEICDWLQGLGKRCARGSGEIAGCNSFVFGGVVGTEIAWWM